ncbi:MULTISPECIES: endonuclease III domain-containing protein [Methanosarcina]|jgi:endonuclease-3|uniref:Endonuclease III n=2 Tax=Methanosarcina mazei TaxID=2209 RepID=A0A0F8P7I2_METMZ|nr:MULTISPECIES: endonuclease III [Methanosarcina]AKB69926.1 Endonuclease III [Methanosarcina mazei C16]KKG12589.1 endonuclease III [Methanosarcina mazei]KKG29688.1 endonuclease III [Methanosarcina mazei]KKG35876.1 endonuclease III [Methanosarcina mazei]KKG45240.1 endonuclease III [Methanosarcina mazei]
MDTDELMRRLFELYPDGCTVDVREPFFALISTVMSHRTRDDVTYPAAKKLFERFSTPEEMVEANVEDIEELIRDVGFYRVKAGRIKEISRILLEDYNGKVPDDMETLLKLPGVGRKTANCVLAHAFLKEDALAVDTHVHRISNRLGLVVTKNPEETEMELKKLLPQKYWRHVNILLVKFGQNVCRPISPRCGICILNDICPKILL